MYSLIPLFIQQLITKDVPDTVLSGSVTIMHNRTELSDDSCDKYPWNESTCCYKHR